jgi:hypothetical protein
MSQGLKINELPAITKNNLETGDLLVVAEKVREGVYATRKLDASYILKLKTEADNAGSDDNRVEIYKNSTTSKQGTTVLNFRGLKAGTDIALTQQDDNIVIDAKVEGENTKTDAANIVGIYAGKNISNSNLKFKSISGEKGLTCRSDSTGAYVSPIEHHYLFVPATPLDPNANPRIIRKVFATGDTPFALADRVAPPNSGNFYTLEWESSIQTIDLSAQINSLPSVVKNSLNLSEKGLALIRIKLNTNSTGNFGHYLNVKPTNSGSWTNKITLDPSGYNSTWEAEDSILTIVEYTKSTSSFNWKVGANAGNKDTRYWQISVIMNLEGFFV